MLNLPNFLSLLRIPLAFLFLLDSIPIRCVALILAGFTDVFDGFIARKYKMISRVGTIIDPITDKFFVFLIIGILMKEGSLNVLQALTMLSRDFSVIIYGVYLAYSNNLTKDQFRAIWCGKATTILQFLILFCAIFHLVVPTFLFTTTLIVGLLAFVELFITSRQRLKI